MAKKISDNKKKISEMLAFWEEMAHDLELPPQVRLKASENIAKYQEGEEVEDIELIVKYK